MHLYDYGEFGENQAKFTKFEISLNFDSFVKILVNEVHDWTWICAGFSLRGHS